MFITTVTLVALLGGLVAQESEALENGLARTPPMGWISWERFTCQIDCREQPNDCINEKLYRDMADRLVADKYYEKGYRYVNIDDCWSEMQREDGNLVPDKVRFPGGISNLAKYIHARDLKLGIYGDCGDKTCAGYPAQLKPGISNPVSDNYFENDAKKISEWNIDSFKFDGCNIDPDKAESICPLMERAINKTGRQILITCEWPFYMLRHGTQKQPDYNLAAESCNLWRYYEDVEDSWLSILNIIDFSIKMQDKIFENHGPGAWFDPDQLVIGNFGLSLDEARAQMAIWSIWSAPLFMSNDLRNIDPKMAAVLKNEKVIAVDQDPLGIFGMMVKQVGKIQVFVKPMLPIKNNCPSYAIAVLNRETLGDRKSHSFVLRDLLKSIRYDVVSRLYEKSHGPDQAYGRMDSSACEERINSAMTRDPNQPPQGLVVDLPHRNRRKVPLEETSMYYRVEDLYGDDIGTQKVGLNSNIELTVNLSGVRLIKLSELD